MILRWFHYSYPGSRILPKRPRGKSTCQICPTCARVDRQRYGRGYWHREHQLAGVLTCPKHGSLLVYTSARPEETYANATFTTPAHARIVRSEHLASRERPQARQISREIARLFEGNLPKPGPARLHAYYRHLLLKAGYGRPNGSIAVARLSEDLAAYYGHSFLRRVNCLPGAAFGWLGALVRQPRSHQQPLRHVLLLLFLGRSVSDLHEALKFTPGRAPSSPHPFRIKNQDRLNRLRPVKRLAWSRATKSKRRSKKDLAIYAWLHRNDRIWLLAQRALRVKRHANLIEWRDRDAHLASVMPALAARILRARPPRRASRNAIASASGAASWLVRDHAHLPRAVAAIKAAAECAADFAIRRIHLVAASHGFKTPVPVWKLRTMAGISTALARRKAVATALYESANSSYSGAPARAER